MTQRMEPGPQRQSQDSQRTIFQGAELCSIQVADDMCPADFTIAMVPLCAFCITLHPLHLLNSSVYCSLIPGLLQWGN